MSFFVYILRCSDNTYYVGCTSNLQKRLVQHNSHKSGAHYTKIRRPVLLVHSETFATLLEARGREAEIKRWPRSKKEKLWLKG
jgi:predicted GIY-YIG superfamily endonuclease